MSREPDITIEDLQKLLELRRLLFTGIAASLGRDGHHKRYEGVMELLFPSYFDDAWSLELSCYVLGPYRSYEWKADSFGELLDKALTDVRSWVAMEEYRDTGKWPEGQERDEGGPYETYNGIQFGG